MAQSHQYGICRILVLGAIATAMSSALAVGINQFQDQRIRTARRELRKITELAVTVWKPTAEHFDPIQVVSRQPVVEDFHVVGVDEASTSIDDSEMVLGVVIDNQPRAYPINIMTGPEREIFNDELGGRPIAATW